MPSAAIDKLTAPEGSGSLRVPPARSWHRGRRDGGAGRSSRPEALRPVGAEPVADAARQGRPDPGGKRRWDHPGRRWHDHHDPGGMRRCGSRSRDHRDVAIRGGGQGLVAERHRRSLCGSCSPSMRMPPGPMVGGLFNHVPDIVPVVGRVVPDLTASQDSLSPCQPLWTCSRAWSARLVVEGRVVPWGAFGCPD